MTTPDTEDASPSPDHSGDQDADMAEQKDTPASRDGSPAQSSSNTEKKPASNAKDPLRPRRKKARRACFACQRAHLTCGDERPCQRCIKRGLQDQCHDGVRKKAKYLHDAPAEALMPGVGGHYPPHMNGGVHPAAGMAVSTSVPMSDAGSVQATSPYYQPSQAANYGMYSTGNGQPQMPPPMQDGSVMGSFSSQATPISPTFNHRGSHDSPVQNMAHPMSQSSQSTVPLQQFGGAGPLFDPSDPALFNFDISSLNFGNQYGAMEFGMLGHMASGAAETPPETSMMNQMNQFSTPMSTTTGYSDSPNQPSNLMFSQSDWSNSHRHGSSGHMMPSAQIGMDASHRHDSIDNVPHAFAIAAGPGSMASASPASTSQDQYSTSYDNAPTSPAFFATTNGQSQPRQQQHHPYPRPSAHQTHQSVHEHPKANFDELRSSDVRQGRQNFRSSDIYDAVTKPYAYTQHFHTLQTFLRKRLPSDKVYKIAQSMASVRPSLISSAGRLDDADLTMCEKQLQRQLFEYEKYLAMYGTPSLVCRRTGEVVAVSKEFCIMTGWQRDVLLGKAPNFNVNHGSNSGNQSGISSGRGGLTTPGDGVDNKAANPVFLAELLDDDSLIQFYDDYARLAFNDSRGTVQRHCRLLKYRTKEHLASLEGLAKKGSNGTAVRDEKRHSSSWNRKYGLKLGHDISGEAGMEKLGEKEGKIDLMFTWQVKRDTFEMPMLLVFNFLPIIPPNNN